jgi:hypothetical protein
MMIVDDGTRGRIWCGTANFLGVVRRIGYATKVAMTASQMQQLAAEPVVGEWPHSSRSLRSSWKALDWFFEGVEKRFKIKDLGKLRF